MKITDIKKVENSVEFIFCNIPYKIIYSNSVFVFLIWSEPKGKYLSLSYIRYEFIEIAYKLIKGEL